MFCHIMLCSGCFIYKSWKMVKYKLQICQQRRSCQYSNSLVSSWHILLNLDENTWLHQHLVHLEVSKAKSMSTSTNNASWNGKFNYTICYKVKHCFHILNASKRGSLILLCSHIISKVFWMLLLQRNVPNLR